MTLPTLPYRDVIPTPTPLVAPDWLWLHDGAPDVIFTLQKPLIG